MHPDFVVVDIDETDLYDDYYRYRELTSRDAAGSISSVRLTPLFLQFHQGLIDSTNKPLYLHRLLAKLYFTKIKYPRIFANMRALGQPTSSSYLAVPSTRRKRNTALRSPTSGKRSAI